MVVQASSRRRRVVELTADELDIIREALECYEYCQRYDLRNDDREPDPRENDDPELLDAIAASRAVLQKLESPSTADHSSIQEHATRVVEEVLAEEYDECPECEGNGYDVFVRGDGSAGIERCDACARLADDDAALEAYREGLDRGSVWAQRCADILRELGATEIEIALGVLPPENEST